MLTIASVKPVPCKLCGRLPSIWVYDKHVICFKPEKENPDELRDYVDRKGHRIKYKIRCPGRMVEKKSEVCHSRVFIRANNIDLVIKDWNNWNSIPVETKEETPSAESIQEA